MVDRRKPLVVPRAKTLGSRHLDMILQVVRGVTGAVGDGGYFMWVSKMGNRATCGTGIMRISLPSSRARSVFGS